MYDVWGWVFGLDFKGVSTEAHVDEANNKLSIRKPPIALVGRYLRSINHWTGVRFVTQHAQEHACAIDRGSISRRSQLGSGAVSKE